MNKILAHTFFPPDESSSFPPGPSHALGGISVDRFLLFLHVARERRVLHPVSVGKGPQTSKKNSNTKWLSYNSTQSRRCIGLDKKLVWVLL